MDIIVFNEENMKEGTYILLSTETPFDWIIKAWWKEELLAFDILNYDNKDIKLSEINLEYISNDNEINIKDIYCFIDNNKKSKGEKINIKNKNIKIKINNYIIKKWKRVTVYVSWNITDKNNKLIIISLKSIKTNFWIKKEIIIWAYLYTWSKTKYNSIKLYFHTLDFIHSKIWKDIKKISLNIYNSELIIFLITTLISFIFLNIFYFNSWIINILITISENIFFIWFSIIILLSIIFRNIFNITRFIFDYIFQIKNIFLVSIFSTIITNSDNLYLNYYNFDYIFKSLFTIVTIWVIIKYLSLNEWKDYKKWYMFNKLWKIYQMNLEEKWIIRTKWENFLSILYRFNIKWNTINPISDEPIWINSIDILKNKSFSKNIYDILNWINFKEFKKSYSIWIVWEWWWWKSSIINILEQQFLEWNPNFKVLKFNSWDYSKENLINNFFWELSKILWVRDISNSLKKYLNIIWNIHSNTKIWIDFLSWFIKSKSLEDIKKEIDEKLNNYWSKIVVIIDDLDRCEPDEVLLMLNLIKNLWDFNNIIYLVSYDKEHIIQVLENKDFSWDYIEKIINIERFIPIPWKENLKDYFKEEFRKILEKLEKSWEKIYANEKKWEIVKYIIENFDDFFEKENLRFIKKLLNQLNIILQINLEKYNSWIEKLEKEDFKNILIINYCKIKDYKLFSEIFKIKNKLSTNAWYSIKFWSVHKDLMYIDIEVRNDYFAIFFKDILWLGMKPYEEKQIYNFYQRYSQYKTYQLYWWWWNMENYFYDEKDFIDQEKIYKYVQKNNLLINNYS